MKLTKEMIKERYHIEDVRRDGCFIWVKTARKVSFSGGKRHIALTDYTREKRVYKGVSKQPRTSFPFLRLAYIWENGEVDEKDYVIYDPKRNTLVAVNRSLYHKQFNTVKRRK